MGFIPPNEFAEKPATSPTMVANRTTNLGHSNSVCKGKEEEEQGREGFTAIQVIDTKALLLESTDVRQTRKEKQIEVLWVPRSRYDTSRKNVANFVLLLGCEVQDNPDGHPAVRFLVAIE